MLSLGAAFSRNRRMKPAAAGDRCASENVYISFRKRKKKRPDVVLRIQLLRTSGPISVNQHSHLGYLHHEHIFLNMFQCLSLSVFSLCILSLSLSISISISISISYFYLYFHVYLSQFIFFSTSVHIPVSIFNFIRIFIYFYLSSAMKNLSFTRFLHISHFLSSVSHSPAVSLSPSLMTAVRSSTCFTWIPRAASRKNQASRDY